MKALKNDCTLYVEQVVSAISDCYEKSADPSNAELMELYSFIGQCICQQGEKAFVVHLAQILGERLESLKGFSPRNLRRMRDFYRTYENSPSLVGKAQALSWTQNVVILECCETDEQRSFYIDLASVQNLSKLALMKAIGENVFATASHTDNSPENVEPSFAPVSDISHHETVDTTATAQAACEPFVTACEPFRQGDSAPGDISRAPTAAIIEIPNNRLIIYEADAGQASHQLVCLHPRHQLLLSAMTDRGKPPQKSSPNSSRIKKKNDPPYRGSLCGTSRRMPHPVSLAA